MRYQSAAAFRTALETRLKEHQSDAVGISRLRKRVVFERLLARLQVVAPDAWVLKGGFALELRLGERARTTKDVDIDWTVREEDAVELLMEAVELDLDDRFEFAIERAALDDPAGGGQRWSVNATLAGREFERVAVSTSRLGRTAPRITGRASRSRSRRPPSLRLQRRRPRVIRARQPSRLRAAAEIAVSSHACAICSSPPAVAPWRPSRYRPAPKRRPWSLRGLRFSLPERDAGRSSSTATS